MNLHHMDLCLRLAGSTWALGTSLGWIPWGLNLVEDKLALFLGWD